MVPAILTYGFFHLQKRQVKKEVKKMLISGIEREDLVLLKFTNEQVNTQLHWEHSKEFKYQDEMYDIVERTVIGDTTYFWCWWDSKETKLCRLLDHLTGYAIENLPEQKENQERLFSFFKSLYITETLIPLNFAIPPKRKCNFDVRGNFSSTSLVPPVPPPEFI